MLLPLRKEQKKLPEPKSKFSKLNEFHSADVSSTLLHSWNGKKSKSKFKFLRSQNGMNPILHFWFGTHKMEKDLGK